MQSFKVAFINEIERMLKRKKAVVVIILSLVIIAILQLINFGVQKGIGIRAVNAMTFPLWSLDTIIPVILPLFTTLVVIDAFASEFNNNTLKISLLKPVTRIKLFVAKIAASVGFVAFVLVSVLIFSYITGFIFNAPTFDIGDILRVILSYIMTLIPFTVLSLFVAMLCHYIKSPVGLFFLCAFLYIGLGILSPFLPEIRNLFFTFNLNWYSLFTTNPLDWSRIFVVTAQFIGFGAMCFALGFSAFEKQS